MNTNPTAAILTSAFAAMGLTPIKPAPAVAASGGSPRCIDCAFYRFWRDGETFSEMHRCARSRVRTKIARNVGGSCGPAGEAFQPRDDEQLPAEFGQDADPGALAVLVELVDLEGPLPGTADWHAKALAAIAKATGGAP